MAEHPSSRIPETCDWECRKCGYLLRGLAEPRCPECGLGFVPGDPQTYRSPEAILAGFPSRPPPTPPGRTFHRLYTFTAIALLCGVSTPGGILFLPALGSFGLIILVIYWIHRRGQYLAHARRILRLTGRPMRAGAEWRFPRRLTLVPVLLCVFGLPAQIGFLLNKPFLDRAVKRAAANPGQILDTHWVGMYPVNEVRQAWGGTRMRVGLLDRSGGFAYLPMGTRIGSSEYSFARVWGDWYMWCEGPANPRIGWLWTSLECLLSPF